MKTLNVLLSIVSGGGMLLAAQTATAQEAVVVEETAVITESTVECKDHYTSSWRDNWFIQFGAGVNVPITENYLDQGDAHRHMTADYNLGFGHWFSPYLGFRFSGNYGKLHYNYGKMNSAQMANLNFDLMWDATSSVCGVNPSRVFSVIPFVGVGGTYTWDFKGYPPTIYTDNGTHMKTRQWTLPVSAGIQLRFRLCKYVDFFAEARAAFYGDEFNNIVEGDPIDCNITAIGGFNINIGGRDFKRYNPCDYLGYINNLNGQVNALRAQLGATEAALAACEASKAVPVAVVEETPAPATPLLSTVRFKINSSVISPEEQVNVYNIAQWLKANPNTKVAVEGYADKDTGTAEYNQKLSERRAQAVMDELTRTYGIDAARLVKKSFGSAEQPYTTNDWNRIVIFAIP